MLNAPVRTGVAAALLVALLGLVLGLIHWRPELTPHVLLLIGLVLLGLGVMRRQRAATMSRWIKVPAKLLTCEQASYSEPYQYMSITYRYPVVTYTYEYAGQTRMGSRVAGSVRDIGLSDADDPEHGTTASKAFWRDWTAGTALTAFVNPKQPEQAVLTLKRSPRQASQDIALMVAGVLIVLLWAVMIFG